MAHSGLVQAPGLERGWASGFTPTQWAARECVFFLKELSEAAHPPTLSR